MSLNTYRIKVTVEYDTAKGRRQKTLPSHAARRLYVRKYRDGKNPKIVKAD